MPEENLLAFLSKIVQISVGVVINYSAVFRPNVLMVVKTHTKPTNQDRTHSKFTLNVITQVCESQRTADWVFSHKWVSFTGQTDEVVMCRCSVSKANRGVQNKVEIFQGTFCFNRSNKQTLWCWEKAKAGHFRCASFWLFYLWTKMDK